jgi:DNA-binding PadR family transcriptional regulator
MNLETYTPIGRTDHLLARMCKENYLMKHRETDTGEEVIQYYIGPRGKTEVGTHGVEGLVREVYGFGLGSDEGNSEERKEFESKLSKSLGYSKPRTTQAAGAGDDNDDD